MLKSELNKLENHISEIIINDKSLDDPARQQQMPEQVKSVLKICNELKSRWTQELFSSAKDYVISRYVQYHQSVITQLSDLINERIAVRKDLHKPADGHDVFYQELLAGLDNLLLFLKNSCYQFFDFDYKLTAYNNDKQCGKIIGLADELRLSAGPEIDPGLIKAILDSIDDKIKESCYAGISYREMEHTLSLLRVVHHQLNCLKETSTESLEEALYRLNVNTRYLYNWYTDRFMNISAEAGNKKEKEALALQEIKRISGIFVEPGKAFEPELPSIDTQILAFLQLHVSEHYKSLLSDQHNGGGRLALDLSVHQFAVFIRVLYKCGCFTTNNISKIVRFFTGHFTTKKTSNVSEKSFARAFYSMDQSAAAVVRDILQRMINYINKTYFH